MAKKCGIPVLEFSIGFGPKIVRWNSRETQITIRLLPVGGFVRFSDEEEAEERKDGFSSAPLHKRVLTVISGPLMNVIFAVILAVIFLCAYGDYKIVVTNVPEDSFAYSAGIQKGDTVYEINDVKIDFTLDLDNALAKTEGETVKMTLERDGELMTYDVPFATAQDGTSYIDMGNISYEQNRFNFFEAVALSFKWLFLLTGQLLTALGNLFFRGEGLENIGGIVQTVNIMQNTMQTGLDNVLRISSLISINLAVINLLPIPALDGGKLLLYIIEGIRKKPVSVKVEEILNIIGFLFIIGLAVFLTVNDIIKLSGA